MKLELKNAYDVGITYKTSFSWTIDSYDMYDMYVNLKVYKHTFKNSSGEICESYFNIEDTKDTYNAIGYVNSDKFIVINLTDHEFSDEFKQSINNTLDSIKSEIKRIKSLKNISPDSSVSPPSIINFSGMATTFTTDPFEREEVKSWEEITMHVENAGISYFDLTRDYCHKSKDLNKANAEIDRLNHTVRFYTNWQLKLHHIFNVEKNTVISSIPPPRDAKYATSLLLCIYHRNKCVSSLFIHGFDPETNRMSIYAETNPTYQNEKNNLTRLLISGIVLLSKDIFPSVKSIHLNAFETNLAQSMIDCFKAKVKIPENLEYLGSHEIDSYEKIDQHIKKKKYLETEIEVNEFAFRNAIEELEKVTLKIERLEKIKIYLGLNEEGTNLDSLMKFILEDFDYGDRECFDPITIDDEKIQDYLKEDRDNFILVLPTTEGEEDKYECASMNYLRKQFKISEDERPDLQSVRRPYYKLWYECKNNNNNPFGNVERDSSFVKLSTLALYVRQPDWIYEGSPPEPRVFKLVEDGKLNSLTTNDNFEGQPDLINFISGDHCNTGPQVLYKLVNYDLSAPRSWSAAEGVEESKSEEGFKKYFPPAEWVEANKDDIALKILGVLESNKQFSRGNPRPWGDRSKLIQILEKIEATELTEYLESSEIMPRTDVVELNPALFEMHELMLAMVELHQPPLDEADDDAKGKVLLLLMAIKAIKEGMAKIDLIDARKAQRGSDGGGISSRGKTSRRKRTKSNSKSRKLRKRKAKGRKQTKAKRKTKKRRKNTRRHRRR